ncbi:MAG: hypothetical protein B6244_02155 [Candidatus Cloacimonetes bacterium 4572_55]|nr:MAG: hypothetical protein B6244_02155 [Candidatus Cloacimonetes bacterium 4572_55]
MAITGILKPILFFLILLTLLFFLGMNLGVEYEASVNLIYQRYQTQSGWIILASAAAGAMLMMPYLMIREFYYQQIIRGLNKKNQSLNQNISQIQNLPIEDESGDIFQE